jgi:WD40 repeat protein
VRTGTLFKIIQIDFHRRFEKPNVWNETSRRKFNNPGKNIVFSSDGKQVALLSENFADIWQVSTGAYIKALTGIEFSNNTFYKEGTHNFSSFFSANIIGNQEKIRQEIKKLHSGWGKIIFSPDENVMAIWSEKDVQIWRLKDMEWLQIGVIQDVSRLSELTFSPNGDVLCMFYGRRNSIPNRGENCKICLYKMSDKTLIPLFENKRVAGSFSFSKDGKFLAVGSKNNTTYLYGIYSGSSEELKPSLWTLKSFLKKNSSYVTCIAFAPDWATFAVACSDKSIQLWNMRNRFLINTFMSSSVPVSIAFSPRGEQLGVLTDENIEMWYVNVGASYKESVPIMEKNDRVMYHQDYVLPKEVRRAGNRRDQYGFDLHYYRELIFFDNDMFSVIYHDLLMFARITDNTILWQNNFSRVDYFAFTSDGSIVATTTNRSADISLQRVGDGKLIKVLKGHKRRVTSIKFSPDGKLLASGSDDGTVRLWGVVS